MTAFRLIAPPFTPFQRDGSLRLAALADHARWLAESGVDGVFVAGSTGEGQSLSVAERMAMTERWIEVAADLEVMVQVGQNALPDAVELAAHAQRVGADAVAASAPCYFKPARVDDLLDFLEPVARAAGDLPFYFYDIPPLTEVRLPMDQFLERGKERIPNLVGLKYSNIDLMQLQRCVQLNGGEFELLYGSDQTLLAGVVLGVRGAVGTTYNFAAPLYRRMLAALENGDLAAARQWQAHSVALVDCIHYFGGIAAFKTVMRFLGLECGPVRPPLTNLTVEAEVELRRRLDQCESWQLARQSPATAVRAKES